MGTSSRRPDPHLQHTLLISPQTVLARLYRGRRPAATATAAPTAHREVMTTSSVRVYPPEASGLITLMTLTPPVIPRGLTHNKDTICQPPRNRTGVRGVLTPGSFSSRESIGWDSCPHRYFEEFKVQVVRGP